MLKLVLLVAPVSAQSQEIQDIIDAELNCAMRSQVIEQGYIEPKDYSVVVGQLSQRQAKTERTDSGIVTTLDRRLALAALPSYIQHEYAHACQMTLGGPSLSLFMDEASATLQEIYAFREDGRWRKAVAEYQAHPEIPPFVDVRELPDVLNARSKFEYGGALFLKFLDERIGVGDGTWVRHLWTSAGSEIKAVNNSGWVQIIETLSGVAIEDLVLEFANWRLSFQGTRVLNFASLHEREIFLPSDMLPLPLGCVVLRFSSANIERTFSLIVQSDWAKGVSWSKRVKGEPESRAGYFKLSQGQQVAQWNMQQNETLHVSVCRLEKDAFLRRELARTPMQMSLKIPGN